MKPIYTFQKRLEEALRIKNMKSVELHEKTGISESLLSKYLSGSAVARQKKLTLLADALNVNEVWLMGYDVPMNRELNPTPLSELNQTEIPVLGKVKAGYDYLAQENIIDHIAFKVDGKDIKNYYGLYVTGDSMEPLFDDGDTVIVHKQDDFENGDYCVVLINGDEATVKRVYKGNTGIELKAVNPYYPPKIFTKEEIRDLPVKVIGVVEKSIRNFKKK